MRPTRFRRRPIHGHRGRSGTGWRLSQPEEEILIRTDCLFLGCWSIDSCTDWDYFK
jgi:hypothetical protein